MWSEGGYYARVFFNVQGPEPQGVIPAADYESFRNEMKGRLEALQDDKGQPMHSPSSEIRKEIYRHVRGPDLRSSTGSLYWRSIGTVGHSKIHVQENDTGERLQPRTACSHSPPPTSAEGRI